MERRLAVAVAAVVLTAFGIVACQRPAEAAFEPALLERHPQAHPASCMPVGSLDRDARVRGFNQHWYASYLAFFQEPPLHNGTVHDGATIYRALILPSISPPYMIRVDRSANGATVTVKAVSWPDGSNAGAIVTPLSRRISEEQWNRLSEFVSATWSSGGVISPGRRFGLTDGTTLVFESAENGRYCVVSAHQYFANRNLARIMEFLHEIAGRFTVAEIRAKQRYLRDLATRERVLGPEHPGVAHSLNDLAELYRAKGHYAEAEPLYQRALAIREKAFGPDDPDVATSLENYAGLLWKTGREDEAKEMKARASAIRAKHAEANPEN